MSFGEVTIYVINYNGQAELSKTLPALLTLTSPTKDIIVIDNNSTDGSREWLKECFPDIRCIHLEENRGVSAARNVALETAETDYVLVLDNDIIVTPDMLMHLMNVMQSESNVGVCHPDILDDNDPDVYHYNGGWIHYLGTFISRPKPEYGSYRPRYEQFDVVSGAAMLINRQAAKHIGYFDGDYFFNWEDGDFVSRLTLAGYRCLNVPAAVVYHNSKPRGTSKVFYQVRNRWYFMLKLYHWRTLVLILPMLCLFELLQAILLLNKGAILDYGSGNLAVLKDFAKIMEKRRAFQVHKKVSDKIWLKAGEMYIASSINQRSAVLDRLQHAFFELCRVYWRIVRPLCG
jgi:GT2 family glycosyltransferase